jgi:hypothetical protein
MADIDRRTVEELVARYELEPKLDDLFVEGVFDREIIASALGPNGTRRAIYEIETVEILPALLAAHDLTEGNKQRVIALARELAHIEGDCSYICFVEKDLDHWLGKLEDTKRLQWSKYCDIETCFLSADFINQLMVITCKAKITNFNDFFDSLKATLSDLYAIRLADRKLSFNLCWISFESCLSIRGGLISLSRDEYVKRLLMKNGKSKKIEAFNDEIAQLITLINDGDCRDHIRGHDFVTILAWSISKLRGIKELASEIAVRRLLVSHARSIPEIAEGI